MFRRALASLSLIGMVSCSADAVPEPGPELETKGAFFVVSTETAEWELYRTLAVLGSGDDDDVFFVVPYSPRPRSVAEATELARDPHLPRRSVEAVGRRYIDSRTWKVVWFRSLSREEEAEFR